MNIEIGTVFILNSLNAKKIKEYSKHDLNIIKKVITEIKPDYLICIRTAKDNHCVCAYAYKDSVKNSIEVKVEPNKSIWVKYDSYTDINTTHTNIIFKSNDDLQDSAKNIYKKCKTEEKLKKDQDKKTIAIKNSENNRNKHNKGIDNKRFDAKIRKKLGFSKARTSRACGSAWSISRPYSAGRGNF